MCMCGYQCACVGLRLVRQESLLGVHNQRLRNKKVRMAKIRECNRARARERERCASGCEGRRRIRTASLEELGCSSAE